MTNRASPTRRQFLLSSIAAGSTVLAGCVEDGDTAPPGDNTDSRAEETGDQDGTTDETNETDPGPGADENVTVEIEPLGAAGSLSWGESGAVYLYTAAAESDPDTGAARQFIDETDFDTQRVLRVELLGPNTCYDHIEFTGVTVEDGRVTGAATAVDTSAPTEMCGDAVTSPAALLRVDALVDVAELELTDGWGESTTVRATA